MERRFRAIQRIGDEVPISHDDDFFEGWPLHRKPIGLSTFILCLRTNRRFTAAGILTAANLAQMGCFLGIEHEVQFER